MSGIAIPSRKLDGLRFACLTKTVAPDAAISRGLTMNRRLGDQSKSLLGLSRFPCSPHNV